jgi:hypothetical protein
VPRGLLLALLCALALPAVGLAARAPTLTERIAITRALPAGQTSIPSRCVYFDTTVSGSYAKVTPAYLVDPTAPSDPCLRYAANGFYLLERSGAKWAVVYTGSELPPCARHFPRDLTSCS